MTVMLRAVRQHLRFVRFMAALMATVAQLAIVGVPLAEATEERDARAHAEDSGLRAHYAHADANCIACAIQHLSARPMQSAPFADAHQAAGVRVDAVVVAASRDLLTTHPPRAPPPIF